MNYNDFLWNGVPESVIHNSSKLPSICFCLKPLCPEDVEYSQNISIYFFV